MQYSIERTIRAVSHAPLIVAMIASLAGCDELPAPDVPFSTRIPMDSSVVFADGGDDSAGPDGGVEPDAELANAETPNRSDADESIAQTHRGF